MKADIIREVEMPSGVSARIAEALLTVKGPQGEVSRDFTHPKVSVAINGNKIVLTALKGSRREKTIIGAFESHIRNIVQGVHDPHVYKLKICSGHFPMNVSVSGQEFIIKNFLGESVPRKVMFAKGVDVKITGADITVTSPDPELAGQTASKIEQLCRITNRDMRIFQDGCYIVSKPGKGV